MSRGGCNIEYSQGFDMEAKLFKDYKPLLKKVLGADVLEINTRGILDKNTGTDALAIIEKGVYGVSLRFRTRDYRSFTLNRHISDQYSEIHKWSKPRANSIKPAYFIQVSNTDNNGLRIIRVNIDAFGYYLNHLIKTDQLEKHYQSHLKSYEFTLKQLSDVFGVWSKVFTLQGIV